MQSQASMDVNLSQEGTTVLKSYSDRNQHPSPSARSKAVTWYWSSPSSDQGWLKTNIQLPRFCTRPVPRQQSCCSSPVDLHANAANPSLARSCEHHLCTAASPGEPYHTDTANLSDRGRQAMLLAPYRKCFADPDLPLYNLTANLPRDRPRM